MHYVYNPGNASVVESVEIMNKMQPCNRIYYSKIYRGSTCFERHTARHQELQTVFAASGLYTPVVTGRCPGWSPQGYLNQMLQIQFGAPDDEWYAAHNMLSRH